MYISTLSISSYRFGNYLERGGGGGGNSEYPLSGLCTLAIAKIVRKEIVLQLHFNDREVVRSVLQLHFLLVSWNVLVTGNVSCMTRD